MTPNDLRTRTGLDPALADGLLAAAAAATAFREAISQSKKLQEQRHFTQLLIAQQPKRPAFLEAGTPATEAAEYQDFSASVTLAATDESGAFAMGPNADLLATPAFIEEITHAEPALQLAPPVLARPGLWSVGKKWLTSLFD